MRNHVTDRFLGSEKCTIKVDPHHAVPFLSAHLRKTRCLTAHSCIHKTCIDATTFLHRGFKTGSYLSLVANVTLERQHGGTELAQFLGGRGVLLEIGPPNHYICPIGGKAFRHAKTNASIATCHKCGLACKGKRKRVHVATVVIFVIKNHHQICPTQNWAVASCCYGARRYPPPLRSSRPLNR